MMRKGSNECHANRRNVAMPSHFGDKAAARLEHPVHLRLHGIVIANPVQRGIRKHSIERAVRKRQCLRVRDFRLQAERTRRGHHLRRKIDACHTRSGRGQPRRKLPIPATEVENAIACLRVEPFQRAAGELVHKRAVPFICLRIPGLRHELSKPPRLKSGRTQPVRQSASVLRVDKKSSFSGGAGMPLKDEPAQIDCTGSKVKSSARPTSFCTKGSP
jgi:hypothetical protein